MTEGTDFLYPFIEGAEQDVESLLADLASSAGAKGATSARLQTATLEAGDAALTALARAMAERFNGGGRLFVFGNGGSATDAAGVVALFRTPPWGRPLRARSLVADHAVLTGTTARADGGKPGRGRGREPGLQRLAAKSG